MTYDEDHFYDVLERDKYDFVFVHKSLPAVFDGVYVDVSNEDGEGSTVYTTVRLSREDARRLATKILELLDD